MTTDPEPLSAEEEAEVRRIVALPNYTFGPLIPRLLATLDEARATPSGDRLDALMQAAQDVVVQRGRYYDRQTGQEDPHLSVVPRSALRHLDVALVALRSVSADSTAGLDAAWAAAEAAISSTAVIRGGRTGGRGTRGWVTVYDHGEHVETVFADTFADALRGMVAALSDTPGDGS